MYCFINKVTMAEHLCFAVPKRSKVKKFKSSKVVLRSAQVTSSAELAQQVRSVLRPILNKLRRNPSAVSHIMRKCSKYDVRSGEEETGSHGRKLPLDDTLQLFIVHCSLFISAKTSNLFPNSLLSSYLRIRTLGESNEI